MNFHKYQALGNTYLVIESDIPLTAAMVRTLCDVNYGIGADGILVDLPQPEDDLFHVVIYNPDGSEAEKSGNGLRIFARYLWDELLVADEPFTIVTKGGAVTAQILDNGRFVHVEMGQVSFFANGISTNGSHVSTAEPITLNGRTFELYRADIGNPHCVVILDDMSAETARQMAHEYGPLIENDGRFPNRTNVQFMRILDPNHIQLEIWERGAGYTLASGSSSCAAAAVAHRLG
ncbi:MAG: diaminopimelate epimerase, partial [Anaerolineales bacterium]|nr:diaminopimelate epimerase [Anaerolineales bacterium]